MLGVSLHHLLGGRPLWLVVAGERASGEAGVAAAMAGLRLSRLPGGAAGRLPLDAAYVAHFRRVGALAVIATAPAASPAAAAAAQRACDAAAGEEAAQRQQRRVPWRRARAADRRLPRLPRSLQARSSRRCLAAWPRRRPPTQAAWARRCR